MNINFNFKIAKHKSQKIKIKDLLIYVWAKGFSLQHRNENFIFAFKL